ncbi:MAG TPA: transcriptional regulator, partial [Chloroflexota bacterium]|nr:transcriptional regulator [Chloroflexota bacterium]
MDELIHQPARLRIMVALSQVAQKEFSLLRNTLGLTDGNLSRHLDKLETAGYVARDRTFAGRRSLTVLKITPNGKAALTAH